MLPIPTILFGILLSSLYGAAFHLWRGGSLRRFGLFLGLSWLGFWLGDFTGDQLGWTFGAVGELNVGMATLGSAIFLLAGNYINHWRKVRAETA